MNHIAPVHELAIRVIPLCRLALAPENVRKTPPDATAEAQLQASIAENGTLHADHPVPCKIAANGNAGELSLAENVVRIAMHSADQVVAFAKLAESGVTVAAIAARFGGEVVKGCVSVFVSGVRVSSAVCQGTSAGLSSTRSENPMLRAGGSSRPHQIQLAFSFAGSFPKAVRIARG